MRFRHRYRLLGTPGLAHPAADALLLFDHVYCPDVAGYRIDGANLCTDIDTYALCRIDIGLGTYGDIILDRARRTLLDAESADDALVVIDSGEIIVDLYGIHRAGPNADAAGDAAHLALLLDVHALVPAVAAYDDRFGGLCELNDLLGTGCYAFSAGRAFLRINKRQVVRAHRNRVKRAGAHAGRITETAVFT